MRELGEGVGDPLRGSRGIARSAAELLGLSAIVVAQPIFDGLQRSTYIFGQVNPSRWDVIVLSLCLVLIPPAVMLAVELLAGLVSTALRGLVHLAMLGALAGVFVWQALTNDGGGGGAMALVLPLAAFLLGVAAYLRFEAARQLVRVLAFAAPVVAALFLFTEPVKSVTLSSSPDPPAPQLEARTPVVVVLFDELALASLLDDRGQVDTERFPNFATLARDFTWYRNAVTVSDSTQQAVPALFTGMLPAPDQLADYAEHPRNLFTLFGASYRTEISESATHLCPPPECGRFGSMPGRVSQLAWVGSSTAGSLPFDAARGATAKLASRLYRPVGPPEQVDSFVAGLPVPSDGATLSVLHVELPHIPWKYLPTGQTYDEYLPGLDRDTWVGAPALVDEGMQRHLLQLAYADSELGKILERLKQSGLYEKAMVVVAADHGVNFVPGQPRRILKPANAGWILPVPLFIKYPGQRTGRVADERARTIDVVPTIAEAVGAQIPWQVDGRSLLRSPSTKRRDVYMAYPGDMVGVPFGLIRRRFAAALSKRNRLFGRGSFYTYGETAAELRRELRGAHELEISVEHPASFNYDPRSGAVPSHVFGSVLGPTGQNGRLIATMNGEPVAVALSYEDGARFTAMLPPTSFRAGANEFALYEPSR